MIKVIMIVVTAIFLSSWYACLVAGKRADEEISALFEKEKKWYLCSGPTKRDT